MRRNNSTYYLPSLIASAQIRDPSLAAPFFERKGLNTRTFHTCERGSASVLVLIMLAIIGCALTFCAVLSSVGIAESRAQSIADFAALGAATSLPYSPESSCPRAEKLIEESGAQVASCTIEGTTVLVQVNLKPALAPWHEARGFARASP